MSFHKEYNDKFLSNVPEAAEEISKARNKYGVQIVEAEVADGETYWKVIGMHHLTPEENRRNHHVYFEVLDEEGRRLQTPTVWAGWTWEGREEIEKADPVPLDKGSDEPAGNVAIESTLQKVSVWIKGLDREATDKSDRVINLHTDHPDELGPNGEIWNPNGQHSFYVVFQRTRKVAVTALPRHYPEYIYGLHEGGEDLMVEAGRLGWILELAEIGLKQHHEPPADYTHLANQKLGVIVRLNHGFGSTGTLPPPDLYPEFAKACAAFVQRSSGCHMWIIGNEPNHQQEWPGGQPIPPKQYVDAYRLCRRAIRSLPGHSGDQVLLAGSAPWNSELTYPGNDKGDWVQYFVDTLSFLATDECDGLAIHTYTRAHNPDAITADIPYGSAGYEHLRDEFRSYRDYMEAIPDRFRHLPVFITETDPTDPEIGWNPDQNLGWVQKAYREIVEWNSNPNHQSILALILYRWPMKDDQPQWSISNREGIQEDFRQALRAQPVNSYRLRHPTAPPARLVSAVDPGSLVGVSATGTCTNQHMITALSKAAKRLGLGEWDLLNRAGLDLADLAVPRSRRDEIYSGPDIDQLPNLTEGEKLLIKEELLQAKKDVKVLTLSVTEVAEEVPAGFLRIRTELADTPLSPPESLQISLVSLNNVEKRVARTWNHYGWLLMTLADDSLHMHPGVAVAVLASEGGQRGFAGDGRMIIRFENHIFFDKWGQDNQDEFQMHFRFDADRPWQKHQWRPGVNEAWRDPHGKQSEEWGVFEFARTLDDTAAKLSLAMGMPQIMGFNYPVIGHVSVDQMYRDFSASESYQIIGFFDLIGGPSASSRELRALQAQDFDTFAGLYHGSRQAAGHSAMLRRAFQAFKRLKPRL